MVLRGYCNLEINSFICSLTIIIICISDCKDTKNLQFSNKKSSILQQKIFNSPSENLQFSIRKSSNLHQKIFKSSHKNLRFHIATTIYLPPPKYNNLSMIRRRSFLRSFLVGCRPSRRHTTIWVLCFFGFRQ